MAIIDRNQRFAFFFLVQNFAKVRKIKEKNNIMSQYSLLPKKQNPPNFEKEIFFLKF
jgi:hypothetical protein